MHADVLTTSRPAEKKAGPLMTSAKENKENLRNTEPHIFNDTTTLFPSIYLSHISTSPKTLKLTSAGVCYGKLIKTGTIYTRGDAIIFV